jgi:hypothetical protein
MLCSRARAPLLRLQVKAARRSLLVARDSESSSAQLRAAAVRGVAGAHGPLKRAAARGEHGSAGRRCLGHARRGGRRLVAREALITRAAVGGGDAHAAVAGATHAPAPATVAGGSGSVPRRAKASDRPFPFSSALLSYNRPYGPSTDDHRPLLLGHAGMLTSAQLNPVVTKSIPYNSIVIFCVSMINSTTR